MFAPHGPRVRPEGLALLALVASCDGRGAEVAAQAATNFGEAMRVVAIIFLAIAALGVIVYLSIWAWFIRGWRRGRAPRGAAVLLVLIHAAALLLWLFHHEPPPLRALSAPVVDLSSAFIHACVALQDGELVCAGDLAARCEDEAAAYHFVPARVDALSAAARVYTQTGLTCVQRRAGQVRCCGGSSRWPAPRAAGSWELPVGPSTSALAVTTTQILARTGDGLQAWPHPLPAGLGSARALAANEGLEVLFAVVDREGALWMWQQDDAAITRLARFPGLADAEEIGVQRRTGACVRRTGGAVACFPWPDSGDAPFEVPDLRASQLVALDDAFDSFCVRTADGAVLCWSEDDPPRPFAALPTATRLVSTNSALCDVATVVRCAPVMHDVDTPLTDLLALPVEP